MNSVSWEFKLELPREGVSDTAYAEYLATLKNVFSSYLRSSLCGGSDDEVFNGLAIAGLDANGGCGCKLADCDGRLCIRRITGVESDIIAASPTDPVGLRVDTVVGLDSISGDGCATSRTKTSLLLGNDAVLNDCAGVGGFKAGVETFDSIPEWRRKSIPCGSDTHADSGASGGLDGGCRGKWYKKKQKN